MEFIREWHIVIMGFAQREGAINGMVECWRQLINAVKGTAARVELRSWNSDVEDLAEFISKLQPPDLPPRICIHGYSWGGMTAANLCRALRRRGLNVDRVVLSDAVYRHWYPWGNWRAFAPWRAIRIPDNVRRVTLFQQKESLPMGHPVAADNPGKTHVDPVKWLKVDHKWMDDQTEFHRACVQTTRGG
jgi:thioesterase domain-containing protein